MCMARDMVFLSLSLVEVYGTGVGQWVTEGPQAHEWPNFLRNFTSLRFEKFGVAVFYQIYCLLSLFDAAGFPKNAVSSLNVQHFSSVLSFDTCFW